METLADVVQEETLDLAFGPRVVERARNDPLDDGVVADIFGGE